MRTFADEIKRTFKLVIPKYQSTGCIVVSYMLV